MNEASIVSTAGSALFGFLFVCAFFGFRKPEERNFIDRMPRNQPGSPAGA
jgi:hypothetical protein